MKKAFVLCLILLLSACTQGEATSSTLSTATPTASISAVATKTITPTITPTTLSPPPTPTIITFDVCCPLEDETFNSLPLIISKPLDIPPFGQDTGHHGIDFSYFTRGDSSSIQGIETYAILSGKVILSLDDKYPYGYAVMIETPLSDLPVSLQESLMANYLPVPEDPGYRLYCPETTPPSLTGEYSIYHLYAHLETKPSFPTSTLITCGETIGTVGNTGWSSNPHLHLETRLGPSAANFHTMCHYQNTCTVEQMADYCLWRMSGYYQLFDPFLIFEVVEE